LRQNEAQNLMLALGARVGQFAISTLSPDNCTSVGSFKKGHGLSPPKVEHLATHPSSVGERKSRPSKVETVTKLKGLCEGKSAETSAMNNASPVAVALTTGSAKRIGHGSTGC
jgi:hypothetical protein